jgi:hypothetical protein
MPGTNAANRVRQNHQLNRRIRTSGGRKRINKSRYEERAPLIVNSHQKRMLKSNPQANITLSKKKLRQLTRAVNIVCDSNSPDAFINDMINRKEKDSRKRAWYSWTKKKKMNSN